MVPTTTGFKQGTNMSRKRKTLKPKHILRMMSVSLSEQSKATESAAEEMPNVVLADASEDVATILSATSWALGECADAVSAAPIAELADIVSNWLMGRRVTTTGVTLGQIAAAETN